MKHIKLSLSCVGLLCAFFSCTHTKSSSTTAASEQTPNGGFQCNTQPTSPNDVPGIAYGPSCTQLTTTYPAIVDSQNPEDLRVICPLLRIVYRSKALAGEITANLQTDALKAMQLPISIKSLIGMTTNFGCGTAACMDVAKGVSGGMLGKAKADVTEGDVVDIGNLSTAKGIAHDCGFNFSYGDKAVNPATRDATLAIFKQRAVDGKISFALITDIKKAMCKRDFILASNGTLPTKNALNAAKDSLEPGSADKTEVNLIYTYLGGIDNGYILYTDLDRFFHADFPANKTKYLVDFPLFAHLKSVLASGS